MDAPRSLIGLDRAALKAALVEAGVAEKYFTTQYERLPDRRQAIAHALARAQPGDVVCVAGKGHETTQEVAGHFHPFDDRLVAQEFLVRRAA